ncbi:MAG TPA: hypothetical protein PK431_04525 [Chitinophagales bacterium]|nr:hypothetical protein [Chitinophagales bacterium]
MHKENFKNISGSIILFVLMYIYVHETRKNNLILKNGVITYGVIYSDKTDGDTRYIDYYYYVGDSIYKGGMIGSNEFGIGDTLIIKYSKDNPKEVITLYKK